MPFILPLLILKAVGAALFFGRRKHRRVAVVRSPRFGILNLKGDAAGTLVALDAEALAPVLGLAQHSSTAPPSCDVLFLYCDIAADGRVSNSPGNLRDLIHASGARVVVVASENRGDAYIASTKAKTHGRANLVMTIARRDHAFPIFFFHLFEDMKKGVSMPLAWVKLAPQGSGMEHESLPETIFACEVGQLAFA